MKKLFSILAGIISLFMLTACGKSSDGSSLLALLGLGGGGEPPVAGTFSKDVFGTGAGPSSTNILFNTTAESRFMILNLASDMKGAGVIGSISFRLNAYHIGTTTCTGVTIKMGHTTTTNLNATYLNNVETAGGSRGTFTEVFSGTVTIPEASSGTYFTITLDTPFHYNGVDNLVTEIVSTAAAVGNDVEISAPPHSLGAYFMVYRIGAGASTNPDAEIGTSTFPYIRFNFAGGDNRLYYGTGTNTLPFWNDVDDRRVQMLYAADEINGSGGITGIGFAVGSTTTADEYTITVRLGHNTSSTGLDFTLGTTTWNTNFNSGSPVTVANAVTFKVPGGVPAGSYIWLPLTRAFNYNGTDNLIVDINVTSGDEFLFLQTGGSGSSTRLDGSADAPLLVGGTQYNVKFRFKGGTSDVIIAATGNTDALLDDANGYRNQFVYLQSEHGIQGRITGLGLRLGFDSTADTYDNFTVVIGQTDSAELNASGTFADNMDHAATVLNGTVTVPDGLKAGDWIEIPFTSLYSVDPTRNLVVYFTSQPGTVENRVQFMQDDTLYPNRWLYDNPPLSGTNTPDAANNGVLSIRFIME